MSIVGDIMKFEFDKNMQIVVVFVLTAAVMTIAQSIVTTGVVCIMGDFSVSSTIAQWTYSSFLLVVGVMIPLSAFISRRFKVRSIFFIFNWTFYNRFYNSIFSSNNRNFNLWKSYRSYWKWYYHTLCSNIAS